MPDNMNTLQRIRTELFELGQIPFALIIGTTQGNLSRLEGGERKLQLHHQEAIRAAAKRLGLPWDDSWIFEPPKNFFNTGK
jgi:transcriptional regulator with XRE-family HTH domain